MSNTVYTFSISDDFPNHKVATDRLTQEIQGSAITVALDYIDTAGDACDIWFKAALSSGEVTILGGVVAVHSGEPLAKPPTEVTGSVKVEMPSGRRCDRYTSNFCNPTTWYSDSLRVEAAVLNDDGDHQNFSLAVPATLVDVSHGKIFGEDALAPTYAPKVYVGGNLKTENYPGTTNGDYRVDYTTGKVIFNAALETPLPGITMDYSKVQSSLCKVTPPEGYVLRVGYVEVQFSKDIGLKDTLIFQLFGLADVFAPGQFPPGTMIPISGQERYKAMSDFIADSEKAYPLIPVSSGGGDYWRQHHNELMIFRFDYTNRATTDLIGPYGMEIRVWLEHDTPFEGEYAVGTFYGVREEFTG